MWSPQGSVLGPPFFLIYVNDMVRACRGLDLVLFADDTNIFAEGRDPAELFGRVNRGLGELSRWFRCNRLTLNLKKTEYVYFAGPGKHGEAPPGGLKIGGREVRRVDGARFLGVWVDEGLSWTGQIEQVRAKVGRLLGVLGRARSVLGEGLSSHSATAWYSRTCSTASWSGGTSRGAEMSPWGGPCSGTRRDLRGWWLGEGAGTMLTSSLPSSPCLR